MKTVASHLRSLSTFAFLALAGSQTASAANKYWDFGATPSTLWSTAANWDTAASGGGGNPAAAPGASDTAIFNITTLNTAQTATLGANTSVGGLIFNSLGTTAINTDGSTNRRLTIGASGITINAGAGTVTFGTTANLSRVPFTLAADQTWTNNSSNALALNNQNIITNAGFTLTVSGSGATSSAASIDGTGGLTKNGLGTLTLTAVNSSYAGVTSLNAGVVDATTFAAGGLVSSLGQATSAAGNLVFGSGTLKHSVATVASTDRLFTIGNASGDTATIDSSAASSANTLSFTNPGAIAFGNTNAHTLTLAGTNTGTNSLAAALGDNTGATSVIKTGAGTWSLAGTNTYHGDTTVSAGTLILANGSQTSFLIGASGTNNAILGSGTINLNGAFVFDLTSAGTTLGDSWTIVAVGTLSETFGASFSVTGFTDLGGDLWQKVNGGATYQFSEASGLLSVTAVPEPSSWALLTLAGTALIVLRRRTK